MSDYEQSKPVKRGNQYVSSLVKKAKSKAVRKKKDAKHYGSAQEFLKDASKK